MAATAGLWPPSNSITCCPGSSTMILVDDPNVGRLPTSGRSGLGPSAACAALPPIAVATMAYRADPAMQLARNRGRRRRLGAPLDQVPARTAGPAMNESQTTGSVVEPPHVFSVRGLGTKVRTVAPMPLVEPPSGLGPHVTASVPTTTGPMRVPSVPPT